VFLACLGPQTEHGARPAWLQNLLAAGGIEAAGGEVTSGPEEAGAAFAASGAKIACLAGSDEGYASHGEAVVSALKRAGADRVFVAGRPDVLKSAGVDGFLFPGQDAVAALTELHAFLNCHPRPWAGDPSGGRR
jgi:methylmalonyl-CoA mutase